MKTSPPLPFLMRSVLAVVWDAGGFAFGGTSRDLLRGDLPNDLDVVVKSSTIAIKERLQNLGFTVARSSDKGWAYYDLCATHAQGCKVHIITGYAEVTDCDINLVRMYKDKVDLLYVPEHLKKVGTLHPLQEVLSNIHRKQFVPMSECSTHRQYRWKKFEDRGWTKLKNPINDKL